MSQPSPSPVIAGTPPIPAAQLATFDARADRHRLAALAAERRRALLGCLARLIADSIVRAAPSPRKGQIHVEEPF
jgi:hypothetical protein